MFCEGCNVIEVMKWQEINLKLFNCVFMSAPTCRDVALSCLAEIT